MATVESPLSLLDVRRALRRNYRMSLAFLALCLAAVAVVALVWPRTFVSEAQFFVKLGRPSVRLDPTATTGQTVSVMESRENEINSILQVLSSRAMAERVVDTLSVETVLGGGSEEDNSASFGPGALAGIVFGCWDRLKCALHGISPLSDREKAIDHVAESLSFSAPKRTNVISIGCTAESPELARKIVAATLEQFQLEHVRVNRTAGSFDFFQQESQSLQERWKQAAEQLRAAKNERQIASVEGQRSLLQNQLDAIQREGDATAWQLAGGQARILALKRGLTDVPERIRGREEEGYANVAGDTMRSELYQLELRERELLSKYTLDHPEVRSIRQHVAEARGILEALPKERTHRISDVNPTWRRLRTDLAIERTNVESLRGRERSLNERRDATLTRIAQLNDDEIHLTQLRRNVELLEQDYRLYADKLEQARTDQALDRQRISNINVFQPATLTEMPISPRLGLLAAFGLVLGSLGGIGIALIAESIDRSLKSPQDVERQLNLPVLVSLPRMASDRVDLN